MADFDEAIRLDPRDAAAYRQRGRLWSAKMQYDKAMADLNEAIRLDPRSAESYANRAFVWRKKGEPGTARDDRERAVRLDTQLGSGGDLPDVFPTIE
jgi:tetratricopeptide (TPR) repeat protein